MGGEPRAPPGTNILGWWSARSDRIRRPVPCRGESVLDSNAGFRSILSPAGIRARRRPCPFSCRLDHCQEHNAKALQAKLALPTQHREQLQLGLLVVGYFEAQLGFEILHIVICFALCTFE